MGVGGASCSVLGCRACERLVGAPAATLRRLQDGGSPDTSGAAGKGVLMCFLIISPYYVLRVHRPLYVSFLRGHVIVCFVWLFVPGINVVL